MANKYVIWDGNLYKKGLDGTSLKSVDQVQQNKLLHLFHEEVCGGYSSASMTAFKILCQRFFWSGMFKDAYNQVSKCEKCLRFTGRPQLAALPLKLVLIDEPFQQWGLDFIGSINPNSSARHTHVLNATDYFTKWVEALPVKHTTTEVVCDFLKENILERFGVPKKIIIDNASYFSSFKITLFCYDYGINLAYSFDYYPQGNGQENSSNKKLTAIIKKLVDENQKNWHKNLYDALWVDRTMCKRAIGMSPFQLVYGIYSNLPTPLEITTLNLQKAIEDGEFQSTLDKRAMYLNKLEEQREHVVDQIGKHQQMVKKKLTRGREKEILQQEIQSYSRIKGNNLKELIRSLTLYGEGLSKSDR